MCVCVTVVATVLARTASSLHSGGGERGRSARSVGVREGAVADVATGLSLVLSDRDALWIGVCLSAGGRKGGRRERRRGKCRTGSGVSGKKPPGQLELQHYTLQQEIFLD